MLGFAIGMVAGNVSEWLIHKYVLHGLGKKKGGFWSFHWHEHHREARRNQGRDAMYELPLWRASSSKSKEAFGIVGLCALMTPLLPLAPGFVLGGWAHGALYYFVHKRSHLDPAWARRYLPWHYDHHMGPNQHANWCVTWPLTDWVLGTREPWLGTDAEAASRARSEPKPVALAT